MAVNPVSQPYYWTFRRVVGATLVLVSVILGFWILDRFNQVIFTLFIAIVIGTVIRPAVVWLHRRGFPPTVGVVFVYLLLLLLLSGFLLLLFPLLSEQGKTVAATMPDYYQNLRGWVATNPNQFLASFTDFLPATLPNLKPVGQTGQDVMNSAGQVAGYVTSAAKVIFATIMLMLLAFYWTLDGPRIIQTFLLMLPPSRRESISDLISSMESRIGYFVIGQSILCLVIGVLALIAYLLIGLPNALVLALIAGVMEAVPMVGPLLGAIPASLVALSIAPNRLIWVIIATVVIQQLENTLLVPRIMKKAVGVNPFVTLLALFAFSSLFGIAGALMAIPLAAVIQLALNHFVFQQATVEMEVSEGRDYTSRIRYEAQDLVQDLRKQARLKKRGSELAIKQAEHVMDEIETITTNLDTLLARAKNSDVE